MGYQYRIRKPKPAPVTPKMREYNRRLLANITAGLVKADDLTKTQLLDLLTDQMDVENERQRTRYFSFTYFRGKTFSLSYWNEMYNEDVVLIPEGTPLTEAKLTAAVLEMDKQQKELSTMFGRFYPG